MFPWQRKQAAVVVVFDKPQFRQFDFPDSLSSIAEIFCALRAKQKKRTGLPVKQLWSDGGPITKQRIRLRGREKRKKRKSTSVFKNTGTILREN